MSRTMLWAMIGTVMVVVLGFGGYYLAVAAPAKAQAALALKQQQLAAQSAQARAAVAASEVKQKELALAQQASQAAEEAKRKRSSYLAACQAKAENVYWNYIKLNGAPVEGQPGVYTAPKTDWDEARERRQDQLDECFRLVDSGVNPDDLAGTVEPTAVPEPATALQPVDAAYAGEESPGEGADGLQTFVGRYLSAGESSDPADATALYAVEVRYFDQGVTSRAAVYKDKEAYFRRWPVRSYTLDSDITTLYDTGTSRQVRFDYSFRVERSGKTLAGRAYTVLDLERGGDGQYVITGERGKVY